MDITAWLQWFLDCLYKVMDATDATLSGVFDRNKFWKQHQHTELNGRQQQMINKLLDGFLGKLTSSKWAKMSGCSPDTALRDIQDLVDKSILTREPGGGRNTSYALVLHDEEK